MRTTKEIMARARAAKERMIYNEDTVNTALLAMADSLLKSKEIILAANRRDLEGARGHVSEVMLDRLMLNEERILALSEGIERIASLPSPLGKEDLWVGKSGILIEKRRVPIGVIAIIYESRPGVTADAAALAIKSGNAVILRSGKEAYLTSRAIVDTMSRAASGVGLDECCIQLIDDTSRESAYELMRGRGFVDLLIPRGGEGLIRSCVENATVPCIETGTGVCHIYIDKMADIDMAINILDNAKTSRPSVCNAAEVCLVHKDVAHLALPKIKERLVDERIARGLVPVELRLDNRAREIIDGKMQTEGDYDTEFLDYVLALGVVDSLEEAIAHISRHSTHHSEAIITEDRAAGEEFSARVDSACVYVNASTRFTDGGEFGFGCEMGISTGKLHARGPMGIKELTTYRYIIGGEGQTR
ncbi:MAG: glutamate-5-semialdehyde dehydrogenase [Clostridia bacterium]|nr:glutamate-5-semialdehyde dehydrogenase [Clostridia bacterium]